MNEYKFEQIRREMEQKYGKMKKGEEDRHAMILFPMESNLLKVHRKHPGSNSRRLKEAILLALHWIDGSLVGKPKDLKRFENEDNIRLRDALLMAFDPFMNAEINDILCLQEGLNLRDDETLDNYYKEPVQCILRILESIEHWEKRNGSNGYFQFLEGWMGSKIPADDEMNYTILVGEEILSGEIESLT